MLQPGVVLLGLCICLLVTSVCVPQWNDHLIYKHTDRARLSVAYLLISASVFITVAWAIEFIFIFKKPTSMLAWVSLVCLVLGSIIGLIACIIYNSVAIAQWSFFFAIIGSTIAAMVGIFNFLSGVVPP